MKIFVVDPALKDQRGHHYALTANIARNCSAAGFRVICLVNKSLTLQADDGLYFVRCFSSDTYDGHAKPKANTTAKESPQASAETNGNQAKVSFVLSLKLGCLKLYRTLPVALREVTTPMIHQFRESRHASKQAAQKPEVKNGAVLLKTPPPPRGPVAELLDGLRKHSAGPQDKVLFHTSDAHTYRDIVELFVAAVRVDDWNSLPQFHLSTPYDGSTMPHNRKYPPFQQSIRQLENLGVVRKKVFLRAEHVLLAGHLSEVLSVNVASLPIPPMTDLPASGPKTDGGTVNVMYLGAARTEKGFPTLPGAIRKVLSASPKLDLCFHIQITPQIMGYTPDVLKAVEELRQISDERLVLIDEPLSQEAYLQLLVKADIMLMNYDPTRYEFRGSGIAVESVLSLTTVISPKGTFPAFIAGPSGVQTDYPGGIAEAVEEIYRNFADYASRAEARRDWYVAEHSFKNFIRVLQMPTFEVEAGRGAEAYRYNDNTEWRALL